MIRYFLAKGDRAGSATITEGLEGVTCSNPPPRVQIATLYMKTHCSACKREGHIAPRGPRRPGTGPNGQQWALSGDINVCGCNPPPVFYAERGMKMTFSSQEVEGSMRGGMNSAAMAPAASNVVYDEQVHATAPGVALEGYPYFIKTVDGRTHAGRIDASGKLPRMYTDSSEDYTVHWGDEALEQQVGA